MSTSSDAEPVAAPRVPSSPRVPLAELGIGLAWLLGLSAVGQIVALLFRTNPMAIVVVQAVIVDLAVGRAGVRWDPAADDKTETEMKNAVSGIAMGAAVALGVTVLAIGVSAALGWARVVVHAPNVSLGLGLLKAVSSAVRDTLLYAGLPLYFAARTGRIPPVAAIVFGALAGGAVLALQPSATPANVALAIAMSGLVAVLWHRHGAGWAAVGAAGGWVFFAGAVFRGAFIDVNWKKGALAPGFMADGAPAWLGAGLFAAVAVILFRRGVVAPARAAAAKAGQPVPERTPEG